MRAKTFGSIFFMQTNHFVTAARRALLFMMVAPLLGGGLSSAPANTADQVASSAKEAKPIGVGTAAPDAGLRGLDGNDVFTRDRCRKTDSADFLSRFLVSLLQFAFI
jgi:hypothetical protein